MVQLFTLLLSSLVLITQPSIATAVGLNTTPPCTNQGIRVTIDAPANNLFNQDHITIGNGRAFGINVKIPDNIAENSWQYYVVILSHPDLGTERAGSFGNRILGSSPTSRETIGGRAYRVYHWDFSAGQLTRPAFTSDFVEYIVELKHAEISPLGADICLGPSRQIRTVNNALAEVDSCPITASDNFLRGDPVTGTVNLRLVDGIAYGYRLDSGNISSQIPRSNFNPIPLTQMPGFNPLIDDRSLGRQTDSLSPGNNVQLPPKTGLNNGTYTMTVYAGTAITGVDTIVFACGSRVITVSNSNTSTSTASGGTAVPPGRGGGVNTGQLTPGQGGLTTTSSGEGCDNDTGIATAIGCIPTEPSALVNALLRFAVAIAGGIAFLLMLFGAFQMITSAGNPDTLKAGQDRFTSAIVGLLFVIFSVLLLQIIGVDILRLPGFLR